MLNGHPAKLTSFLNYQKTNLQQVCPDKRPTRFNDKKLTA